MKLSKSWDSYKFAKRRSRRFIYHFFQKSVLKALNIFLVLILVLVGACEEEIPALQNSVDPLNVDTLVMRALSEDSLNFVQGFVAPSLGQASIIYVGNDTNVFAYSLLKFSNFERLPDSIESFISLSLNLKSYHQFRLNSADLADVEIDVYQLQHDLESEPWTEDSSTIRNFDISAFDLKFLGSFAYADTDIVFLDLDTTLISEWYHAMNSEYTLVLMQADTNQASMQTFYSDETSLYPWLEISYPAGDTIETINITPEEDLSILKFKQDVDAKRYLSISAGRAAFAYMKFAFEDSLSDENRIIAKADLEVKIDRSRSVQYGELFNVYVTLIDTTIMLEPGVLDPLYNPKDASYNSYHAVGGSADSVIVNLRSLLQGVTSKYLENHGVVLWSTPGNLNISSLSIYNASAQNPINYRPVLRVLTFKEQ